MLSGVVEAVRGGTADDERDGSAVEERVERRVRGGARRVDVVLIAFDEDGSVGVDVGWTGTARLVAIGIVLSPSDLICR